MQHILPDTDQEKITIHMIEGVQCNLSKLVPQKLQQANLYLHVECCYIMAYDGKVYTTSH